MNRSNSKIVNDKVDKHVKSFYDDIKLLADNKNSAGGSIKLVESGDFLVYYYDQRKFLDSLNLNNKNNREFDDQEVWNMYKLLVSRSIDRLTKNA